MLALGGGGGSEWYNTRSGAVNSPVPQVGLRFVVVAAVVVTVIVRWGKAALPVRLWVGNVLCAVVYARLLVRVRVRTSVTV